MGKFMVRLIIASLFVSIQRWCIPDIRWTVALLHHKISSMRHRLLKILKSYTENAVNHKKEQDWEFFLLNIDKIITLPPTAQDMVWSSIGGNMSTNGYLSVLALWQSGDLSRDWRRFVSKEWL